MAQRLPFLRWLEGHRGGAAADTGRDRVPEHHDTVAGHTGGGAEERQ